MMLFSLLTVSRLQVHSWRSLLSVYRILLVAVAIFSLYSVHLLLKTANEGGESVTQAFPNASWCICLLFLISNPLCIPSARRCTGVRAARLQSLRDTGETRSLPLHHHAEHRRWEMPRTFLWLLCNCNWSSVCLLKKLKHCSSVSVLEAFCLQ